MAQKIGKPLYYDEYMYTFVLKEGVTLAYLKAEYGEEKKGGIQHIIDCLEAKTAKCIVMCKECFENNHLPFAKAVYKQGVDVGAANNIVVCFNNWMHHLKLDHGIKSTKAAQKQNVQHKLLVLY
jgi:hypothetical protein